MHTERTGTQKGKECADTQIDMYADTHRLHREKSAQTRMHAGTHTLHTKKEECTDTHIDMPADMHEPRN